MNVNLLEKVWERHNWANQQIIAACLALTDEQLDAPPQSATYGTIRSTLEHLVAAQVGYLGTLTLPLEERKERVTVPFDELQASATRSGEGFLALARDPSKMPTERLQTRDGYWVEPWVLMVQAIDHASEHREQIKSMLTALGITPPDVDGWCYAEATGALVPIEG